MKDAVKRTTNRVKLYFRRRKLLKDVMRQWADSLIMQQDTLRMQQQPSINQMPLVAVPAPQPIQTAEDAAIAKSVDELVFAIDQEANAPAPSPVARNNAMMDVINRRVGV